jgi:hypothetical protein
MSAFLKQIAAFAKGLNKAELHVLIELASRAESSRGRDAIASSRELAETTGLARSSIQLAIDSLNQKELIHSDAGTPSRSASHVLLFLTAVENNSGSPNFRPEVARESNQRHLKSRSRVAQFSGQDAPLIRTAVARNSSHSGPALGPGVAQVSGQGGPNSRPAPNQESITYEPPHIENASALAHSIERNDLDRLIDRLQKAKKSDFDEDTFEQARNLIASHHAKFAREGCQIAGLPDDQITAQFLAIAEWPRLSQMLYDLLSERKQPSFSWGWYVTVALQRIHGISPDRVRALREKVRKTATSIKAAPIDTHTPMRMPSTSSSLSPIQDRWRPSTGMGSLKEQIRMLAASKSMR